MLNLNDTHLAALIAKPLNVSQLRQQISTAYQTEADRLADRLYGVQMMMR